MLQVTPLIQERIRVLNEVATVADFFFVDELPPYDPAELIPQKGDAAMAVGVLEQAAEVLATAEFTHDALEAALREAAATLKVKTGQMFQPIRVAVCGRKTAPAAVRNARSARTRNVLEAHRAGARETAGDHRRHSATQRMIYEYVATRNRRYD